MWIPDKPVGASDEPKDQFGALLVDYIVMRCPTHVPQVESGGEKVTDSENGQPLGSAETLPRNTIPTEACDLYKN